MTNRIGTVRRGAGLLVVAALVGACGSDDGEGAGGDDVVIEATPAFLSEAAERSQGTTHRMAMTISLDGGEPVPMLRADVDGDRYSSTVELGAVTTALAEQTGEQADVAGLEDMTMEMVGDASQQYIRTPMFAMVAEMEPGALGPAGEELAQLGDRWGRVDLDELGIDVPADVQEAVTGQGVDPSAFFDLVADAEGVEDLGEDEIDGVAVTGLSADVAFRDVLATSGTDAGALAESVPGEDAEQLASVMEDLALPLEVWVDDDGLVRRLRYLLDMEELLVGALDVPADELTEGDRFALEYTIDVTDYGADDIDIRFPEDAVDVTDAFASLMGS